MIDKDFLIAECEKFGVFLSEKQAVSNIKLRRVMSLKLKNLLPKKVLV